MSRSRAGLVAVAAVSLLGVSTLAEPSHAVTKSPTVTSLSVAPASSLAGQPVSISASVAVASQPIASAAGRVVFKANGKVFGTAVLANGVATLTTTKLGVGALSLTASYKGTTSLLGSVSAAIPITVARAGTAITLTASDLAPAVRASVLLRATVVVAAPSGEPIAGSVTFSAGTKTLKSVKVVGGVAALTTTLLPPGPVHVVATFKPGSRLLSSSTNIAMQGSGVAVSSDANPQVFGAPLQLSVSVAAQGIGGATPSGVVVVSENGTPLGAGPVGSGVAVITLSSLPGGAHSLAATYSGDSTYLSSTNS